MGCSHSTDCPLFAQFAMEPALAIWKKHFCEGEYTTCARYQLGLKGETVPITLLPNGKMIEKKTKTKEEMGGTALFNAILKGRVPMVRSMLSSKMSSVQITSTDGSTPLMAAASVGNLEIINILLESGCNPYIENNKGINALLVADNKKFSECAEVIREFMSANPELESKATGTESDVDDSSDEEESEINSVVSLLKKLNPFSR